MSKHKTIVLDLNGIFIHKVQDISNNQFYNYKRVKFEHYTAFLRPKSSQFVKWCLSKAQVGIYTSTTRKIVNVALKKLFNVNTIHSFLFICCRSQCSFDPDYVKGSTTINEYDTIKLVDNLIQNPVTNRKRDLTKNNILMVDDSASKQRFNPPENVIIVPSWRPGINDSFELLKDQIEAWLERE